MPDWVIEFLKVKAPWWLECDLEIVEIDEDRKIARIKKDGFTYALIPAQNRIV